MSNNLSATSSHRPQDTAGRSEKYIDNLKKKKKKSDNSKAVLMHRKGAHLMLSEARVSDEWFSLSQKDEIDLDLHLDPDS